MRYPLRPALRNSILCAAVGIAPLLAGDTATQQITFSVEAIDEIAVSGPPAALMITEAAAGDAPRSVQDDSTAYAVTTNGNERKITAALDQALPAGVTLNVTFAAPNGATATGPVTLSAAPADVVTNISAVNETSSRIRYELTALASAGTIASQTRTIVLTITAAGR